MKTLKDELKVRPGEGAVEYAERIEGVLERHEQETGEKVNPRLQIDGEDSSELVERFKKLGEADSIRWADRDRARGKGTSGSSAKDTSLTGEKSSRSFRLKSQERDVERTVSAFEEAQKKLYRTDGSGAKVYGDEEHTERLGKLRQEFAQRLGKVVSEVEEDAKGYEKEAHSYTYTDPTKDLTSSERARLDSSRPLVAEDCERLSVEELTQRIRAVSAGTDKVAKVLHARYGTYRVRSIEERRNREFQAGTARPGSSAESGRLSALRAVALELEEQLKDPKMEERRQATQEAAKASRQLVREARRQQGKLDGTTERARERQAQAIHAAF